jgi:hypothetical protein
VISRAIARCAPAQRATGPRRLSLPEVRTRLTCRELVYEELEDADNPDQPVRQVLQSRVLVIDSATLPPEARLAVAEVSQTANGLRVKMHDKHGPLVSIGKHLGMFVDQFQVRARYANFPIQNFCRPRIGGERPSDEGRTRCRHRDDRPVMNRPRL